MIGALASEAFDPEASFLDALTSPAREPLLFRVAVIVAHPDDETIGCGALLRRLPDVTIIHVTDGAPRNLSDAEARGFANAADYAAARRRELEDAVALAGISPERLVALGWPDQQASLHLAEIATALAEHLAGAGIVLTHAYEGGHPDHDATAFAVHAACALLRRSSRAPTIIEMPLYRAGPEGILSQTFAPDHGAEQIAVALNAEEQRLKRAMLAAHRSQRQVLAPFSVESEQFRLAPRYDFTRLPNAGALHYERFDWGMTGQKWLALAAEAERRLRRVEPA